MSDKQRVSEFLQKQAHMVLGVVLEDGSPWAVPVRILHHEEGIFEWDSVLNTEHSQAIERDPRVMLLCFDTAKDAQIGVYMQAEVTDIARRSDGYARYHAEVRRTWLNDETYVKREV